ncbi:MAG: potassium/proton antiporter [Pseudomonadales bacterium]
MDFSIEPSATALLLLIGGALLMLSVLLSRVATGTGVPVVLIFLLVGMLAGSEGLGGIEFADYELAFRIGTAALAVILFDGGLNTSRELIRRALAPAGVLATVGVAGTAALVAVGARLLGFGWGEALLLGAIVSSTDAAAVFSILRGSHMNLRRRVAGTLDLESGLNDPVAVILTMSVAMALVGEPASVDTLAINIALQLAIGAASGAAIGIAGGWLLTRLNVQLAGLYPILTLAVALLAFSLPTLLQGSGYLAAYVAGVVLGQRRLPYRSTILHSHNFIAWLAQMTMFLTMGLLVFPSDLLEVAGIGVAIALILALVARPVAVFFCLAPFRFPIREQVYIAWVGLRGAVPIVLAMFPLLAGVEAAPALFNIVFFVVVLSVLLQGVTAAPLSKWLRVQSPGVALPSTVVELTGRQVGRAGIHSFWIHQPLLVCGMAIRDLTLPGNASIIMVLRDEELIPAGEELTLQPDDHVYILCGPTELPVISLLFGSSEQEA